MTHFERFYYGGTPFDWNCSATHWTLPGEFRRWFDRHSSEKFVSLTAAADAAELSSGQQVEGLRDVQQLANWSRVAAALAGALISCGSPTAQGNVSAAFLVFDQTILDIRARGEAAMRTYMAEEKAATLAAGQQKKAPATRAARVLKPAAPETLAAREQKAALKLAAREERNLPENIAAKKKKDNEKRSRTRAESRRQVEGMIAIKMENAYRHTILLGFEWDPVGFLQQLILALEALEPDSEGRFPCRCRTNGQGVGGNHNQHCGLYLYADTGDSNWSFDRHDNSLPYHFSGDIECHDVGGNVETTSGDIECGNVGGNVETTSGDVKAENINGNVETVSGDIKNRK